MASRIGLSSRGALRCLSQIHILSSGGFEDSSAASQGANSGIAEDTIPYETHLQHLEGNPDVSAECLHVSVRGLDGGEKAKAWCSLEWWPPGLTHLSVIPTQAPSRGELQRDLARYGSPHERYKADEAETNDFGWKSLNRWTDQAQRNSVEGADTDAEYSEDSRFAAICV